MEDKRQVPWEKAEAFAQQEGLRLGTYVRVHDTTPLSAQSLS